MYEEYLVLTNVAERTKPVDTPMIKSQIYILTRKHSYKTASSKYFIVFFREKVFYNFMKIKKNHTLTVIYID